MTTARIEYTLDLTHHGAETSDYPFMHFTRFDERGAMGTHVALKQHEWQALGEPKVITVTIQPG